MLNPKILDDLSKQLADLTPPSLQKFKTELEEAFHQKLQKTFEKLDFVTREEFDIQSEVLNRTRQRLEQLEKKVDELEQKL